MTAATERNPRYIDNAPNIVEHEREFKRYMRARDRARAWRKAQAADLRARLAREVAAARTRPFYDAGWES